MMPDGGGGFGVDYRRLCEGKQVRNIGIETKSVESSDDFWTLKGVATPLRVDRMGDIVEPMGAKFRLPVKLLLNHKSGQVIGNVVKATKTRTGIDFEARIPKVKEDGVVKERIAEAVHSLQYKLIDSTSIGFNPDYDKVELLRDDKNDQVTGFHFKEWEWLELSLVPIPANPDARITQFKSIDDQRRALRANQSQSSSAAPGQTTPTSPGASGKSQSQRGKTMPGIAERLTDLVGKSTEMKSRMNELSTQCDGDVTTLSAEELNEFDGLNARLDPIEKDIARLEGMQRAASKARPIDSNVGTDPDRATRVRNGDFNMKSNLPKGTLWTRAVLAQALNRGSRADAVQYAKQVWRDTPEVAAYLAKANAGTGASGNWAEYLNTPNFIENEFLEVLLPMTLLGKLNMRKAAFDTKMLRQLTGASNANWVGNAAAKPVGEQTWDFVTVPKSKIADIVVLSDDQIKSSHINSVEAVRVDLMNQIARFADAQFTDPTVAATASNPASVTNGVNDIPASGVDASDVRVDLKKLLTPFIAAHIGLGSIRLITTSHVALGISLLTNALGQAEFPTVNVTGGTLMGIPVIVSDNVPGSSTSSLVIAIAQDQVLFADDGGIVVDSSREATLDMAGGNSPTFNLWQKNCVALRAEWFVSWIKGRTAAVQYISGAAYAPS